MRRQHDIVAGNYQRKLQQQEQQVEAHETNLNFAIEQVEKFCFLIGQSTASFWLFSSTPHDTIQIEMDDCIPRWCARHSNSGGRMEGNDESTELGDPPQEKILFNLYIPGIFSRLLSILSMVVVQIYKKSIIRFVTIKCEKINLMSFGRTQTHDALMSVSFCYH